MGQMRETAKEMDKKLDSYLINELVKSAILKEEEESKSNKKSAPRLTNKMVLIGSSYKNLEDFLKGALKAGGIDGYSYVDYHEKDHCFMYGQSGDIRYWVKGIKQLWNNQGKRGYNTKSIVKHMLSGNPQKVLEIFENSKLSEKQIDLFLMFGNHEANKLQNDVIKTQVDIISTEIIKNVYYL